MEAGGKQATATQRNHVSNLTMILKKKFINLLC